MKQLFKALASFCVAAVMAFSIITVAGAEEIIPGAETSTVYFSDDDGSKAYQLVWKYKYQNGHYYKRRWNKTLGAWYDPDWILVQ